MTEIKNKPQRHITREQILLVILILLILVIAVLLIRALIISQIFKNSLAETTPQVPPFLSVPLPSLKNIQDALNDPKLDDLQFYHIIGAPPGQNKPQTLEDLAKQVKIGNIGRPNPFVPFVQSPAKK